MEIEGSAASVSARSVIFRLAAIVFASIIKSSGSSSVVFIWETIWFYGQASMGRIIDGKIMDSKKSFFG